MYSDRSRIYRERAADCLLKASILSQTDEWRRVAKVWETLASMHEDMPAISGRNPIGRETRSSADFAVRNSAR